MFEIEVERLKERVNERFPTVETDKPELGRVGIRRGIELWRETDVVGIEMVLRSVTLLKGGVTATELVGVEGTDMKLGVIEGVPITISVVIPAKTVFLYLTIVWRALAVRVRVCKSKSAEYSKFQE